MSKKEQQQLQKSLSSSEKKKTLPSSSSEEKTFSALSSSAEKLKTSVALVLPPIRVPPKLGWPRVGSTWEFRLVALLNLLLTVPVYITVFVVPFLRPEYLCLIHAFLCFTLLFTGPGAHPVFVVARVVALHLPFRPVPGHPKKFAMMMVVAMLVLQIILSAAMGPTCVPYFIILVNVALILDSVFGVCLGCLIYSDILVRYGMLPDALDRDYKRPWRREEVLGIYARWLPTMYAQFARPLSEREKQEEEFEIQCKNGVCRMVPKQVTPMTSLADSDDYQTPETGLQDLWQQIVTPLAENLSEATKKKGQTTKLDPKSLEHFIPISSEAVALQGTVENALSDFKLMKHDAGHGGDMSEWTEVLFDEWHHRFLDGVDMGAGNKDPTDSNSGLTFRHPYFRKQLWTTQEMLGEKSFLNAFTDDVHKPAEKEGPDIDLDSPVYQSGRDAAYKLFKERYPAWALVKELRELRDTEYQILDKQKAVYLDYTAGGLPSRSQLDALSLLLRENVLGNPHSACPASLAAAFLDKHSRDTILAFLNTNEDEYDIVFTQNASGACKIIADNFAFTSESTYLYSYDNHNSVVGIREWAKKRGASVDTVSLEKPELRLNEKELKAKLKDISAKSKGPNLFGYPAQSNVSGVKHSLDYIKLAQDLGWYVLCDVAAFVPSSRLDLSVYKPHFAPISFYKIFGYPTGLGALLVRKDAYPLLVRTGFMGGTVRAVTVHDEGFAWMSEGHPKYEDGTVNYLNIPAVEIGLRFIERIGIDNITTLVSCLTGWLIENLLSIKHPNGKPLVILYGPHDTRKRGGTIVINLVDPDGVDIHAKVIEQQANHQNINVRVGCFCNPGCSTAALDLQSNWAVNSHQKFGEVCLELPKGPFAMIRISIGLATNFDDVYRMYLFISGFTDPELVKKCNNRFWPHYVAPGGLC